MSDTMLTAPADMFDRVWEWRALSRFALDEGEGATLGVVSGRRRQGKSFLLRALTEAAGGLYVEALEGRPREQLDLVGRALAEHLGAPAPLHLEDWDAAVTALLDVGREAPVPVVIDELGYLVAGSPELPSVVARALNPRGRARRSTRTRLLVCGSAVAVMGRLLAADAPLRGRASLELVVQPLDARDAARFWDVGEDWELALHLAAVVGGTPAYRREFVRGDVPRGLGDFDDWVCRTVLDPSTPLFREGRYLLAEDPGLAALRDRSLYHATLAAIATGRTTRGAIASYLERPATDVAHPLAVLEDAGFIARREDALRRGRPTYAVTEPLVRFYHAVMRPRWGELERPGAAERVWQGARQTFRAQVLGPAFEELCRTWALRHASEATLGGVAGTVGSAQLRDAGQRTVHEVDVVVTAPEPQRRVLLLGEAKAGETMGVAHLARLERVRGIVADRGRHDAGDARLGCFGGAGFTPELRAAAAARADVELVDLERLYTGS